MMKKRTILGLAIILLLTLAVGLCAAEQGNEPELLETGITVSTDPVFELDDNTEYMEVNVQIPETLTDGVPQGTNWILAVNGPFGMPVYSITSEEIEEGAEFPVLQSTYQVPVDGFVPGEFFSVFLFVDSFEGYSETETFFEFLIVNSQEEGEDQPTLSMKIDGEDDDEITVLHDSPHRVTVEGSEDITYLRVWEFDNWMWSILEGNEWSHKMKIGRTGPVAAFGTTDIPDKSQPDWMENLHWTVHSNVITVTESFYEDSPLAEPEYQVMSGNSPVTSCAKGEPLQVVIQPVAHATRYSIYLMPMEEPGEEGTEGEGSDWRDFSQDYEADGTETEPIHFPIMTAHLAPGNYSLQISCSAMGYESSYSSSDFTLTEAEGTAPSASLQVTPNSLPVGRTVAISAYANSAENIRISITKLSDPDWPNDIEDNSDYIMTVWQPLSSGTYIVKLYATIGGEEEEIDLGDEDITFEVTAEGGPLNPVTFTEEEPIILSGENREVNCSFLAVENAENYEIQLTRQYDQGTDFVYGGFRGADEEGATDLHFGSQYFQEPGIYEIHIAARAIGYDPSSGYRKILVLEDNDPDLEESVEISIPGRSPNSKGIYEIPVDTMFDVKVSAPGADRVRLFNGSFWEEEGNATPQTDGSILFCHSTNSQTATRMVFVAQAVYTVNGEEKTVSSDPIRVQPTSSGTLPAPEVTLDHEDGSYERGKLIHLTFAEPTLPDGANLSGIYYNLNICTQDDFGVWVTNSHFSQIIPDGDTFVISTDNLLPGEYRIRTSFSLPGWDKEETLTPLTITEPVENFPACSLKAEPASIVVGQNTYVTLYVEGAEIMNVSVIREGDECPELTRSSDNETLAFSWSTSQTGTYRFVPHASHYVRDENGYTVCDENGSPVTEELETPGEITVTVGSRGSLRPIQMISDIPNRLGEAADIQIQFYRVANAEEYEIELRYFTDGEYAFVDRITLEQGEGTYLSATIPQSAMASEGMYELNITAKANGWVSSGMGYTIRVGVCEHPGTITLNEGVPGEFEYVVQEGNECVHLVVGNYQEFTYCTDCGEEISRSEVIHGEYTEEHTYAGKDATTTSQTCTKCGHTNGCSHDPQYLWHEQEWIGNPYVTDTGSHYSHQLTGTKLHYDRCTCCGVYLNMDTIENYAETQQHEYYDGYCVVCGHVNTCTHSNTYEWVNDFEYWNSEYISEIEGDNHWHLYTGPATVSTICSDCGQYVSNETLEQYSGQFAHRYQDGVCADCGHICTHEYGEPQQEGAEDEWIRDDDTYHHKVTWTQTYQECQYCYAHTATTRTITETGEQERHEDSDGDDICDICNLPMEDYVSVTVEGNVLLITGYGEVPGYFSIDAPDWSGERSHIERVIVDPGITKIGAHVLSNLPDGVRIDFRETFPPVLDAHAMDGTSGAVCRYYSNTPGWPAGWIYLPRYNEEGSFRGAILTADGWTLEHGAEILTPEQIREATYLPGRTIIFECQPTEDDCAVFNNWEGCYRLEFGIECKGNMELTLDARSDTDTIRVESAELTNLEITDQRTGGLEILEVNRGTVTYEGNVSTLILREDYGTVHEGERVTITGGVGELHFYDETSGMRYGGTLTVNGTVSGGYIYGVQPLKVQGIGDIPFSGVQTQRIVQPIPQQTESIILNGELNLQNENNYLEDADPISLDQFDLEYQFQQSYVRFIMRPKDQNGGYFQVEIGDIYLHNINFTPDDILYERHPVVSVYSLSNPDEKLVFNGSGTGANKKGIYRLNISPSCYNVTVNCPVDTLSLICDAQDDGTVDLTITDRVEEMTLYITGSDGCDIRVEAGGSVAKGKWDRGIRGVRHFSGISAGTTVCDDGQVKVMTWKEGHHTKAILPSDSTVSGKAGVGDGQTAMMDVEDVFILDQDEQDALAPVLMANGKTGANIAGVFDASVTAYSISGSQYSSSGEEGTDAGNLNGNTVSLEVENPGDENTFIVRLHREDNGAITAERIDPTDAGNTLTFGSDLFSTFVIVSGESTYIPMKGDGTTWTYYPEQMVTASYDWNEPGVFSSGTTAASLRLPDGMELVAEVSEGPVWSVVSAPETSYFTLSAGYDSPNAEMVPVASSETIQAGSYSYTVQCVYGGLTYGAEFTIVVPESAPTGMSLFIAGYDEKAGALTTSWAAVNKGTVNLIEQGYCALSATVAGNLPDAPAELTCSYYSQGYSYHSALPEEVNHPGNAALVLVGGIPGTYEEVPVELRVENTNLLIRTLVTVEVGENPNLPAFDEPEVILGSSYNESEPVVIMIPWGEGVEYQTVEVCFAGDEEGQNEVQVFSTGWNAEMNNTEEPCCAIVNSIVDGENWLLSAGQYTVKIGLQGSGHSTTTFTKTFEITGGPDFTQFVIPAGTVYIEDEAFSGIAATAVEIPNRVETIGNLAFGDSGITAVHIPSSVWSIGEGAFPEGTVIYTPADSNAWDWASDNGFVCRRTPD